MGWGGVGIGVWGGEGRGGGWGGVGLAGAWQSDRCECVEGKREGDGRTQGKHKNVRSEKNVVHSTAAGCWPAPLVTRTISRPLITPSRVPSSHAPSHVPKEIRVGVLGVKQDFRIALELQHHQYFLKGRGQGGTS